MRVNGEIISTILLNNSFLMIGFNSTNKCFFPQIRLWMTLRSCTVSSCPTASCVLPSWLNILLIDQFVRLCVCHLNVPSRLFLSTCVPITLRLLRAQSRSVQTTPWPARDGCSVWLCAGLPCRATICWRTTPRSAFWRLETHRHTDAGMLSLTTCSDHFVFLGAARVRIE